MNHNTHNFFLKIGSLFSCGNRAIQREEAIEILKHSMQEKKICVKLNDFVHNAALAPNASMETSFTKEDNIYILYAVPKDQKLDSRYTL